MNGQVDARKMLVGIHEIGETDGHRRQAHQAVQDGDEFRHLGHLHTTCSQQPDTAAGHQGR